MRAVLVLFALAGAAVASPTLRWLDETGGFRAAAVKRVIEETATSLKLELASLGEDKDAKPRVVTIPMLRVLEFVREDDTDKEQKRLIEARAAVLAGVDLDKASATLDQLSGKGRESWVREYAAAYRTIAAHKRGEKDAWERITKFLRAYPNSRFVADVIRARAWIDSLVITNELQIMEPFGEAFLEIGKRNGPYAVQYGCLLDAALRSTELQAAELRSLGRSLEDIIKTNRPDATAPELVLRLGVGARVDILVAGIKWRDAAAAGVPTAVIRDDLAAVENGADLLLPDAVVELRMEQAALAISEKRFDDAERYYKLAAKQEASVGHRLLLKRARDQLSALRSKR